jgi:hypothetical protein
MKRLALTITQFVTLLGSLFGGFYTKIAPPDDSLKFWPSYASLLAGLVFIVYVNLGRKPRTLIVSIAIALAAILPIFYYSRYQSLTENYSSSRVICGTEPTTRAAEYISSHPGISKEKLIFDFGGKTTDIWTEGSINRARLTLGLSYSAGFGFLALVILSTLQRSKESSLAFRRHPNSQKADLVATEKDPQYITQEITAVDPLSILTSVTSGLSLIDKFNDLVRKLSVEQPRVHRVEAKRESPNELVIRQDGQIVERVTGTQLRLDQWDGARWDALNKRVLSLWNQFNGLYGQLPNLSIDEQIRIKERMENMRHELCKDFREMVEISERVLGVPLSDHYSLYSTCQDGLN